MDTSKIQGSDFTYEPTKIKESSKSSVYEQSYGSLNKEHQDVLTTLMDLESDITQLTDDKLRQRFEDLRKQVEVVFQKKEGEMKDLCKEIQRLKTEVQHLKEKNERLEKLVVLTQTTWMWEAHLARFVIDPTERVHKLGGKFRQMEKYLNKLGNQEINRWTEIKGKLTVDWTEEHWEEVRTVRAERNSIAHPEVIDLDLVESEIENDMSPDAQKLMNDMLDILKMTASLMKFGRLAKPYEKKKHLFQTRGIDANALKDIVSWDRKFEQIGGLQNIGHEEGKEYLAKYVAELNINHYLFIVDFIKEGNKKRLGKLAWEFEKRFRSTVVTKEERQAIDELKKLLRSPRDESNVADAVTARLHIPDFLPRELWKHGISIVEKYFKKETV